ncbi:MAG: hypothetical protein KTR16_03265 [Acidiferrobacterales bacterium]|nr:hypothetical protein [Acidiferrobacterales bacterium]
MNHKYLYLKISSIIIVSVMLLSTAQVIKSLVNEGHLYLQASVTTQGIDLIIKIGSNKESDPNLIGIE